MGCRQSHAYDPDSPNVESIHYKSRRPTKLKKSKRKSLKQNACQQVSVSAATEDGEDAEVSDAGTSLGESAVRNKSVLGSNGTKNVNERVHIFGNKSTKNALTKSVDTPEAAEIEAKHGKIGTKHVFPIWGSRHNGVCKCVSLDLNEVSSNVDGGRETSTPAHHCKKCSQGVPNNKRGLVNNNNSKAVEANGSVDGNAASGSGSGGGGGSDVIVVDKDGIGLPAPDGTKHSQIAAIVNLLALAALDLSAPASSVLVKNRKNAWIQLAGHPGSFAPAGPNTIWKKRISKENYEALAYTALKEYPQSQTIMPAFHSEVEFNGEHFIEMEDLLHHFSDPSIMDIKMGTRTFLEAEVKNPVLRKDLFEKMIKVDPNAPTADESAEGAITKLRYMQFREQESSTASLGFRIEAIRMSGEPPNTSLKKVKTKEEVSYFFETFLHGHEVVMPILYKRLSDIREKFESIPFFSSHEIIGSSLLIMYDNSNHAGAWMIDFAKTIPVAQITLNHRSTWKPGNHEDGYLFGLDNLIEIFGELVQKHRESGTENVKSSS